jgi:hypothetical protein
MTNLKKTVRALPPWLAAFLPGLVLPWLVWSLGHLWPSGYDSFILPFLYKVVLPFLWIALLVGAGVACIRPDEKGFRREAAMFLLGLAVGTLVANDWWYFTPFAAMITIPLVAWHFRWHFWSQSRWLVVAVVALVIVLLGGAVFDFHFFIPELDNRFSLGLPGWLNIVVTLTLITALAALLTFWALRYWHQADEHNRLLLADIIEREPRCAKYFDAVARLTTYDSDRKAASPRRCRFQSVAKLDTGTSLDPLFPDLSLWRPSNSTYWNIGYKFAGVGRLTEPVRFLRSSGRAGEFPSPLIRELLTEALKREHQACFPKVLRPNNAPENTGLFEQFIQSSPENLEESWEAADRHFSRYALLREALLEASSYFFLDAPQLTQAEAVALCPELTEQLKKELAEWGRFSARESDPTVNLIEIWRSVSTEYRGLWIEQIDRLFMRYGDGCAEGLVAAGTDFNQLTCNFLAARRASRPGGGNLHSLAADISLVFLLTPAKESIVLREALVNYFKTLRAKMHATRDFSLPPEDWREIGLCASAYGLASAFNHDWDRSRWAFTLFEEFKTNKDGDALRIDAHLYAASVLHLFRRQGGFGMVDNINAVVLAYLELNEFKSSPVLFDGRFPPEFLACAFARHLCELEERQARR